MTINECLEHLKVYCKEKTKHFQMPETVQKGDVAQNFRAPEVYKMRLSNSSAAKKLAPYIIVQYVNSMDKQPHGKNSDSTAFFRFIFCVFCDDEQKGMAMLLNVMDAVRIGLLKDVVIADRIKLDTDAGLEMLPYNDDTAPYYAGELVGTFILPPIEREAPLNGF